MKNSECFVQRKAYGYISLHQLCLVLHRILCLLGFIL